MTLNQCTKQELIFIINRMAMRHVFGEEQRQSEIKKCLNDVEYRRVQKLLNEADNWNKIAADCRRKYCDILKQYEGKRIIDIPVDVIKKAEELLKDAQRADKKWDECMRKVDEYEHCKSN